MELDLGCWWGMGSVLLIMVPYFLSPEREREREREREEERRKRQTKVQIDQRERKKD